MFIKPNFKAKRIERTKEVLHYKKSSSHTAKGFFYTNTERVIQRILIIIPNLRQYKILFYHENKIFYKKIQKSYLDIITLFYVCANVCTDVEEINNK